MSTIHEHDSRSGLWAKPALSDSMGMTRSPAPVKLIAGLLASSDDLLGEAAGALSRRFSPADAFSTPSKWDLSSYYRDEMGDVIWRQFLSFEDLIAPDMLAESKQITNSMEGVWRTGSGRRVNIDPGYIAATKLVLASTKDAAHRVYLSRGIYAEATLHFRNGSFQPYPYSYRDYAAAIAFFNRVRTTYLAQLRAIAGRSRSQIVTV
jgi:hypothetical protein